MKKAPRDTPSLTKVRFDEDLSRPPATTVHEILDREGSGVINWLTRQCVNVAIRCAPNNRTDQVYESGMLLKKYGSALERLAEALFLLAAVLWGRLKDYIYRPPKIS